MMKFILWILGLFGYRKEAAAVEAYQVEAQKETDEQVQEIQTHEQQIDAEAEAAKSEVDSMSESDLDEQLRR